MLKLQEMGVIDQEKQGVSTLKFLSSDNQGFIVELTVWDSERCFATRQYRISAITS